MDQQRALGAAMTKYWEKEYSDCVMILSDVDPFFDGPYYYQALKLRYLALRKIESVKPPVSLNSTESTLDAYIDAAMQSESKDILLLDFAIWIFTDLQDFGLCLMLVDLLNDSVSVVNKPQINTLRALCNKLDFEIALSVLIKYPTVDKLFDWIVNYCISTAAHQKQKELLAFSLETYKQSIDPLYHDAIEEYIDHLV